MTAGKMRKRSVELDRPLFSTEESALSSFRVRSPANAVKQAKKSGKKPRGKAPRVSFRSSAKTQNAKRIGDKGVRVGKGEKVVPRKGATLGKTER